MFRKTRRKFDYSAINRTFVHLAVGFVLSGFPELLDSISSTDSIHDCARWVLESLDINERDFVQISTVSLCDSL